MRSGRCGSLSRWPLVALLLWLGCTDKNPAAPAVEPPPDSWEDVCVDDDGDGYGLQCDKGPDCDDEDPAIFEGCKACAKPNEGCSCEVDALPVDCTLSKEVTSDGTLLCKTGTRYCRDGKWSGCEGIRTFTAPPPSRLLTSSLIDPDAGLVTCSSCSPDCYQVEENPNATGGDSGVTTGPNGGITLGSRVVGADGGALGEGGNPQGDGGLLDDPNCVPGTAPDFDCDGIPDEFDPLPGKPPFSSDHNTIFMDLGPGDTQEESFEVRFYVNTADIYLYLDMTGSMDGEKNNLIDSLRNGNYMTNGGAGVECADRNFNGSTADEEYLKSEGIAGNLACLIRDSRLGAGWHRDLPLPKADAEGFGFGPHDFEAFQHEQDITADIDAVLNGLGRFATRGGINRPEGGILGLYALATGSGLYMGWNRPGNVPRTDCGPGRWGYACFRDDAVPIVIWITDAPITNGPAPAENRFESTSSGNLYGRSRAQPVNWDDQALRIETGTDSSYTPVAKSNETFASALHIGDVSNSFRTYVGDTTGMAADVTYQALTGAPSASYVSVGSVCETGIAWSASTQTAPDAVFKFTVTQEEPITISTRGSRWRTALAILDARRIDSGSATASPASSNFSPAAPYDLGTLDLSRPMYVSGSTSGATGMFTRDAIGCLDLDTSSSDKQGAVVLKFNLDQDVSDLRISSDMGSGVATALFSGRPGVATDTSLSSSSFIARLGTANRAGNSNDEMNAYSVGDIAGAYRRFTGGTTSDSDITAQYSAAMFAGVDGCGAPSGTSPDAVWDFSLSAPTRVRIEGMGDNDTLRAGFDHMIGLVRRNKVTYAVSGNTTDATAHSIDLNALPGGAYDWLQYNGTLAGSTSTYLQSEVGPFVTPVSASDCTYATANSGGAQAVFVVDVPSARTLTFDTAGTGTNTWLSLHRDVADTQTSVGSANSNNAGAVQALGAVDEISLMVTGGSLASHGSAAADYVNDSNFGCTAGNGGRDAIYSFTVNAAQTVSISAVGTSGTALVPGTPGFNARVAVFRDSISAANRVGGGCTDQTGNGYEISNLSVSPGRTYYVVVKSITTGSLSSSGAQYGLWVRDTTFSNHFMACDYGSQLHVSAARASKITRALSAGRYYLVVKGANGGAYQLNVRPTPSAEPTLMACDRESGGDRHSRIDRDLPAGDYAVILRGYTAWDEGSYQLVLRDLGAAPAPVSCVYDGNASQGAASVMQASLAARDASNNPIDYYLVMRGNNTTGSYSIRVEPGSGSGAAASTKCAYDNVSMSYSQTEPVAYTYSTDINNAEWTGTLPVGEYYAVLKGYDMTDATNTYKDNDYGIYQFTIGDQTNFESTGRLDAKRWLGPNEDGVGGVREALLNRQIRVIMVDSTTGSGDNAYYSDQQMKTIAQATGAVALDGSPLFFKIKEDGTGLGTTIVEAVNQLAGNLAMDVGVRLVEAPDSPAPKRFNFRVEAIDMPGDLCQPPVDTDNDPAHTPDTHVKCTPGAVPRFKVTLSNPPAPNNVPPNLHPSNPDDTRGGYEMRLELIGDGQFVVDQIPLYIIPEDVVEQVGETRFEASGVYEQTVDSNGCFGNEAPLWRDLGWKADIPEGTSLTWNVCTADTEADLTRCTPQLAAAVQTSGSCITDSNCPVGYCNASNVCEMTTGAACGANSECGINGQCVAGFCQWTRNPIDVKPALARSMQGKRFARVQVVMTANAARNRAPTIHNWGLKYTCTAQE